MPSRRWPVALGALTLALSLSTGPACADGKTDPFPEVAAAYRVDVDGVATWYRGEHRRLPPASLTKLMTLLLAAEEGNAADSVTISSAAASESGKRAGVRAGERWRLAELIAASLVASGNDACLAVAEHVGGTQSAFVKRMNERAQRLGMTDTHFTNPCGHDAPAHYSSAADLALLAGEVLEHAPLRELARLEDIHITSLNGKHSLALTNTNALLGRHPDVVGLKTGSTARAGTCLIAVAQRNGHQVIVVMLRSKNRWWDASDIVDIALGRALSGT